MPGSRPSEVERHVPVMMRAVRILRGSFPDLQVRMVLPNASLAQQAKSLGMPAEVEIRISGLPESLAQADLAIASTGTVTMECAWFGVPTVTLYKASWSNYQIARLIVKVNWLTMPNLLANEEIFPEFIQDAARPQAIARAGLELLCDESRRAGVKARLAEIVASLGGPGAPRRESDHGNARGQNGLTGPDG